MKTFFEYQSGMLVRQLLGGVTFTNHLPLGSLRDCWKGFSKDYNSGNENSMFLAILCPIHDLLISNSNSLVNSKVVSWYVNFRWA